MSKMVTNPEGVRRCADLLEVLRLRSRNEPDARGYIFLGDGETEAASLTYGELARQARAVGA